MMFYSDLSNKYPRVCREDFYMILGLSAALTLKPNVDCVFMKSRGVPFCRVSFIHKKRVFS